MSVVLFDFDGTLADTAPLLADVIAPADGERSEDVSTEERRDRIRDLLARPADRPTLFGQIAGEAPGTPPQEVVDEIRGRASLEIRLYPGVYRLLLRLRRGDDRAALFTRWPDDVIAEVLADLGLEGYLEPILCVPTADRPSPPDRAIRMLVHWLDGRGDDRAPGGSGGGSLRAPGDSIVFVTDDEVPVGDRVEGWAVDTIRVTYGYGSSYPSPSEDRIDRIGEVVRYVR